MDVKDWLKIATLFGGIALIGIGVTVGVAHSAILVPLGVGMVSAVAVKSSGVSGLVEKAKASVPPAKGGS